VSEQQETRFQTELVRVSGSAKQWLERRQSEEQARLGRTVSFGEIVDKLIERAGAA
jgi:hypothetical protein